ncbi:MAG: hypothetical protein HS114_00920 [Anaerolineales bacterium]|nr:hypothetical protein [Anaerolineales bacterium]
MKNIYKLAGDILRSKLQKDAPAEAAILGTVVNEDVIVLYGGMDHVEDVLEAAGIPFRLIYSLDEVSLAPSQLLIINCPGHVETDHIEKIRSFVESGGSLITTDWALHNVLEKVFPGYLEWNYESTGDEVVGIKIVASNHPFVAGIITEKGDPQWWLESSSYPIRVLDHSKVSILIDSPELGKRYKESAVAVFFPFGRGDVFHMISHYYLQRTELKSVRHSKGADDFIFGEMNLSPHEIKAGDVSRIHLGEIESAYSAAKLMSNIIIDKKRKSISPDNETEKVLDSMAKKYSSKSTGGQIKLSDTSKSGQIRIHNQEKTSRIRINPPDES